MARAEWVTCIQKPDAPPQTAWCGERGGWMFTGVDHAIASRLKKDRLTVCPQCCKEIERVLKDKA